MVQMSCHSATFALQRGCFGPREWLAVKGLFCMVAHNCHSKTKNLTAKTKYLTAKPKTSRQNKTPHGKTKNIYKEPRQDSGQRNISYTRYPKKCFTQTYRDLYGDAMLVLTNMSSNTADGNQQKHLLPSFATKA